MTRVLVILLMALAGLTLLAQEASQEPTDQEPDQSQTDPATPPNTADIPVGDLPVPDFQAPTRKGVPGELPGIGNSLFNMVQGLLIVLAIILALSWVARKYLPKHMGGGMGNTGHLKILQSLPLGPKRYVTMIEADGKRFLLGVTEQQINLLTALDRLSFEQAMGEVDAPQTVAQMLENES